MTSQKPGKHQVRVVRHASEASRVQADVETSVFDWIVSEEPLEILVGSEPLVVTMRTPGADEDLALGFLHSEGLISESSDVVSVFASSADEISLELSPRCLDRVARRQRHARVFPATSACGVCGKPSLENLWQRIPTLEPLACAQADLAELVASLPERLLGLQPIFADTGGLHAAAVFDLKGRLQVLREDVGRHNAVDKVLGWALASGTLPLHQSVLWTSGRAGYEIVQKALAASVPVVAAMGATTTLALEVAAYGKMDVFSFVGRPSMNQHRWIDHVPSSVEVPGLAIPGPEP